MSQDTELLSRYAADHSESAFAELIRRHMDLVYSAALRVAGGDVHRAQDVTQLVFAELARQANGLKKHPALVGWLYTTTRLMALRLVRTERRRQAREQEANTMNELLREPAPDWEYLRPVLEEAMHELGEKDRLAVLLRYFKNKSLKDVGLALGLSDNAARMRVERALDKLRLQLARKGVTSTAAVLAATLSAKAVTAAPVGLATTLTAASLATAAASTGTTLALLKIMSMTYLKLSLAALVVAGAATTLVIQHQTQITLRQQNQSLQQKLAQLQYDMETLSAQAKKPQKLRLPAPPVKIAAQTAAPIEELHVTNLYARYANAISEDPEPPYLTSEQVEAYLKANGRKASNLLAAYHTSGDLELLKEAMRTYPNDPQVAFEAALNEDLSLEQRRQWLNAFEQAAPNNAMANYLSALNYFKAGQPDQAVQELMAASDKQLFQDYTANRMQDNEEAYLAAGYSIAEAKLIGSIYVTLPQLAELKQLGLQMVDLSNSYRQAGDATSAQNVLQMAISLGQRYGENDCHISHLVGLAIERNAFSAMDPSSPYGENAQTVQDQLDHLTQQKSAIKSLVQQGDPLLEKMSDQDWISYTDRLKISGEKAAQQWVVSKYGQK